VFHNGTAHFDVHSPVAALQTRFLQRQTKQVIQHRLFNKRLINILCIVFLCCSVPWDNAIPFLGTPKISAGGAAEVRKISEGSSPVSLVKMGQVLSNTDTVFSQKYKNYTAIIQK